MHTKFIVISFVVNFLALHSCKNNANSTAKEVITASPENQCSTPTEIDEHQKNVEQKPYSFCFHKIQGTTQSLLGRKAISPDKQLKSGLEVAFLNHAVNFDEAQAACKSLGSGWHAPSTTRPKALPRALTNNNSLEALGLYFQGANNDWFWSSSTSDSDARGSWYLDLAKGEVFSAWKDYRAFVVCIKP